MYEWSCVSVSYSLELASLLEISVHIIFSSARIRHSFAYYPCLTLPTNTYPNLGLQTPNT